MNVIDVALSLALEENERLKQELGRLHNRLELPDGLQGRTVPSLLETVTDSLKTFIIYVDSDKIVRFINIEACTILNAERHQIVGKTIREALSDNEYEIVGKYVNRALLGETVNYEIQTQKDNRGVRVYKAKHLPHFDASGKVLGFVGIVHETTEHAKALNALALTEERLRMVVANAPVLIFSMDMKGVVTFAEGCGLDILAPEAKDYVGKTAEEIFPEQWEIHSQIDLAIRGFPQDQVVSVRGKAFEIRSTPLRDANGDVVSIIGVAADISARKHAEDRIMRVNRLYSLLSKTNEAIVRIKDRNELFERVCSIAVEDGKLAMAWVGLLNKEGNQVFPAAVEGNESRFKDNFSIDLEKIDQNQGTVGVCIREGHYDICQDFENDQRMKFWLKLSARRNFRSCASFPLMIHQKVEGVLSFYATEISYFADEEIHLLQTLADNLSFAMETLRKDSLREEAEKALRESETKYRRIVETTNEGIWVIDPNANTVYVNHRMAEMLEYTVEEMIGQNLMTFMSPDFLTAAARNLTRRKEGISEQHNSKYRCKSGKDLWAIVATNPLYSDDNQYLGALAMVTDITERKSLEEQLLQSQKMEGIGRLAGGIAHDFNNLLTVILGFASMALMDVEKDSNIHGYLEQIKQGGERAAALTNQLLSFARKQLIEPRVFRLDSLALDMDKMLRRLIGEKIQMYTIPRGQIWHVLADPGQIEQVLVNLVVNARDAMPDGGVITIDIQNINLIDQSEAALSEVAPGDYVMLSVMDTGLGMEHAVKERLFEPFFTTKDQGKGTGLGLATSYGIAHQSGGCLIVDSEPGNGSTFKLYLPRIDEDIVDNSPCGPSLKQRGYETILIVEDETMVREYVVQALRSNGYTILEASSGIAALKLADEYTGKIDLLLTDIVMPNMSGQQLSVEMQKRTPDLKVLFASGYTDDTIIHRGVLENDVSFLQKPYTPDILFNKVRDVLDGS